MIYDAPASSEALDQGDLIDDCPVLRVRGYDPANLAAAELTCIPLRGVILTQTCDLAADTFSRIGLPRPYETL
jgi:hypothetical protein